MTDSAVSSQPEWGPVHTVDYHTAGEPFRIVTAGVDMPEGATVLDRRTWAQQYLDEVRKLLINEPRGHADMYGCFVTQPDDAEGDLGVVFFHKDGFSTACGHGTIALVTWAIDSGLTHQRVGDGRFIVGSGPHSAERVVEVMVDAPSGRLRTEAHLDADGRVEHVRFWNVDAFVTAVSVPVPTARGVVPVDVSFGGAYYGSVDLEALGLAPEADDLGELIGLAREIKAHFFEHAAVTHADDVRLSGMYGVIFFQDVGKDPLRQRNVTVFADGEVDRSPCGSGTSARLALLHHHGQIAIGQTFLNEGIADGVFDARVESVTSSGELDVGAGLDLIGTSVAGSAYRTAETQFVMDPRDPLGIGFQLR